MLFDPTANTMQQEVGRIWATDKGRGLTSPHVTCSLDTPLAPILLHVPLARRTYSVACASRTCPVFCTVGPYPKE